MAEALLREENATLQAEVTAGRRLAFDNAQLLEQAAARITQLEAQVEALSRQGTEAAFNAAKRLSEKAASNEEQERRIAASSAAIEAKWTSMVTTLQTYHNIEKRRLQGEVEAAQKNLEEKKAIFAAEKSRLITMMEKQLKDLTNKLAVDVVATNKKYEAVEEMRRRMEVDFSAYKRESISRIAALESQLNQAQITLENAQSLAGLTKDAAHHAAAAQQRATDMAFERDAVLREFAEFRERASAEQRRTGPAADASVAQLRAEKEQLLGVLLTTDANLVKERATCKMLEAVVEEQAEAIRKLGGKQVAATPYRVSATGGPTPPGRPETPRSTDGGSASRPFSPTSSVAGAGAAGDASAAASSALSYDPSAALARVSLSGISQAPAMAADAAGDGAEAGSNPNGTSNAQKPPRSPVPPKSPTSPSTLSATAKDAEKQTLGVFTATAPAPPPQEQPVPPSPKRAAQAAAAVPAAPASPLSAAAQAAESAVSAAKTHVQEEELLRRATESAPASTAAGALAMEAIRRAAGRIAVVIENEDAEMELEEDGGQNRGAAGPSVATAAAAAPASDGAGASAGEAGAAERPPEEASPSVFAPKDPKQSFEEAMSAARKAAAQELLQEKQASAQEAAQPAPAAGSSPQPGLPTGQQTPVRIVSPLAAALEKAAAVAAAAAAGMPLSGPRLADPAAPAAAGSSEVAASQSPGLAGGAQSNAESAPAPAPDALDAESGAAPAASSAEEPSPQQLVPAPKAAVPSEPLGVLKPGKKKSLTHPAAGSQQQH